MEILHQRRQQEKLLPWYDRFEMLEREIEFLKIDLCHVWYSFNVYVFDLYR
jgi:hypothetical protein